jgi:hypothetical protein
MHLSPYALSLLYIGVGFGFFGPRKGKDGVPLPKKYPQNVFTLSIWCESFVVKDLDETIKITGLNNACFIRQDF